MLVMLVDLGCYLLTGAVRYHLSEYGSRHNPTNAKELYNLRHSSLIVTIERVFGAIKNRF